MSVTVLGSANLDLVYRVERIPSPGETVLAAGAVPVGKGNNQVTAVARSGADATFIAALGKDAAAERLIASLTESGVALCLRRVDEPTGTAVIKVDEGAENAIVVDAGANGELLRLTSGEREAIAAADALLMQLETPVETVTEAALAARAAGTAVVLNAAPIPPVPAELMQAVDLLIVNEHEAARLAAAVADAPDPADEEAVATVLSGLGLAVIVTLGARGALVCVPGEPVEPVPGLRVDAVDTTGAGDTFCGALLAELDRSGAFVDAGGDLRRSALVAAAAFATAAAALSVQCPGAVLSIPTLEEIHDFRSSR
ncbi:ribokinase [Leifsonia xyli subsp. xyli]|uniref:Ribokinase n=2 Tax=Leifsonia xyli subsp. xyli TaxID=59736 RepID=Q6ADS9_LEIXX|nr:ribokinase [Leifsonia xyli]AAT89467.1 ribokinase [Leifsonia xyli subsp. xyli str. CTCB07]ODA90672.1 ribokinase [Leifsonia xyli subsp. xyli]